MKIQRTEQGHFPLCPSKTEDEVRMIQLVKNWPFIGISCVEGDKRAEQYQIRRGIGGI